MNNRYRPIWILVLALCASAAAMPTLHAEPLGKTVVNESSVMVPANGEATIAITAYCLKFGEPFPKAVKVASTYAGDNGLMLWMALAGLTAMLVGLASRRATASRSKA